MRRETEAALAARESTPKPATLARVSRAAVDLAIHDVFHLIGGVPAMADWAQKNPDKFYPMFAKLTTSPAHQPRSDNAVTIEHALPESKLDGDNGQD